MTTIRALGWRPSIRWNRVADDPLKSAWWSMYLLLLGLPLLILVRRSFVSFRPLDAATLVLVSMIAAIACLCVQRGGARYVASALWPMRCVLASLSAANIILLASISISGSAMPALVAAWCIAAIAHTWLWTIEFAGQSHATPIVSQPSLREHAGEPQVADVLVENESDQEFDDETSDTWPPEMTQQITRLKQSTGETLLGGMRLEFSPGERQQAGHIAFCPPLTDHPQIQLHQTEGPAGKVELTLAERYGLRFEVRLEKVSSASETVVVQFEAVSRS